MCQCQCCVNATCHSHMSYIQFCPSICYFDSIESKFSLNETNFFLYKCYTNILLKLTFLLNASKIIFKPTLTFIYKLGKNMFLVPVVSVDFVNGPYSKLDHRLVLALSKRLFFIPIFERR